MLKDSAVSAICHGANLNAPGVSRIEKGIEGNELISMFSLKNELVALGKSIRSSDEIYKMKTGAVVDLERVVMSPELYPKKWNSNKSKIENL